MPLQLTNLPAFKAYFEAIAIGPTHHVDIDGFKFGDRDVAIRNAKSGMEPRVLWLEWYKPFNIEDELADNILRRKRARLAYMKTATSELESDEATAYDECEKVMEQILAKMLADKREVKIVTTLSSYQLGPFETELGATKYIGCAMDFEFKDNSPLVVDPTKWTT